MSEKFVTLARQRDGLIAVLSLATEGESGPRCALIPRRIEEAGESVCRSGPAVARAWRTLARVRLDDPQDLAAAVVVLLETVPLDDRGGPSLGPVTPAPAVRRTRAHPRGAIVPRRPRAAAVDLRGIPAAPSPWLAVRRALRSHGRGALRVLRDAGYDDGGLQRLLAARDPYVAYHHHAPGGVGLAVLPRPFRTAIVPLLRRRPWPEVMGSLRLYRELDLEHDPERLALVARLLALSPDHGPAWWARSLTQLPERRGTFLTSVLQTGAHGADPAGLSAAALDGLAGLDAPRYDDRLTYLLQCLCAGYALEHAVEGFTIADAYSPDHVFVPRWRRHRCLPSPPQPVPLGLEPVLRPVLAHIASAVAGEGDSFPMVLWQRCVDDPAFAAILGRPVLLEWPGGTTLRVLRWLAYEDTSSCQEQLRAAEHLLSSIPETHHGKAIDALDQLFARWGRGERQRERMPVALALVSRLARPPFRTDVECGLVVAQLVEAALPKRVGRLLGAPERCLSRLDAALRRENQATLLRRGFEAMARLTGGLLVDALIQAPEALFGAARLLGCLSHPRRLALLGRYRANPMAQRRFLRRPLEEVWRRIEPLVRSGVPNPVPRRLRDHLAGRISLTPASLERHRQALARGLLPFKLGLIRRMVLDDLARGLRPLDLEGADERHALQMLGTVSANRRILRRVLSVAPAGRREFLLEHPANRAWLHKHPMVKAELWTRGLERVVSDGSEKFRLATETDPLAVLRLGTDVGSCLSVGGACNDSAVAVMVDVNKQVVFARRLDGTFLARQIVAVTEDDRLLFFPVYPLSAATRVKDGFHKYDLALAAALGLRPFERRGQESYEVADILSRDSYDDGPWERFVMGGNIGLLSVSSRPGKEKP